MNRRGIFSGSLLGASVALATLLLASAPVAAEPRVRTVGSASDADHLRRGSIYEREDAPPVFGTVTRSASQARQQGYRIDTSADRSTVAESFQRVGSVRQTASEARNVGRQLPSVKTARSVGDFTPGIDRFGSVTSTLPLPDTVGVETLRESER